MCITTRAASLDGTYIGVWDVEHPDYGYRHVLAYQNVPTNKDNQPNCMLLHVASKDPILPEHILNTEDCPDFLRKAGLDLFEQWIKHTLTRSSFRGKNFIAEMGIYHVAILNDVSKHQEVLAQIPAHKRPNIEPKFFDFFSENFKGFPLLLCCFNNKEARKASPIMVHFNPVRPDIFQVNALESHGDVPNMEDEYDAHQFLIMGSCYIKQENKDAEIFEINWSEASDNLLPFLPKYGGFLDLKEDYVINNMDILINADSYKQGHYEAEMDVNTLPRFTTFDYE